ncbi:MAG TPA: HlyD family efflux transporter periplasmic adaptor subunit [Anaerolineales bacterium]|nr:HlyD family efflux transporter periplasmic adaptor subunit [Anaerolineales bacterium]
MSKSQQLILLVTVVVFILSACSPAAKETISPGSVVANPPSMVSATGEVVPEQEALLSVTAGGIVEDVLVVKGDTVSSGQVLVRLEGSEGQIAAVSTAELELLNAQLELEALYRDTDLMAAQALNSTETAERALEDLKNPELQQAQALQAVADAEKAAADAERNLVILTKPAMQSAIDQAQANILLAEKKMKETLDQIEDIEWQFKKYSSNKELPADIRKNILTKLRQALKGLEVKRTQEQIAYINSQTKFNDLLAPPDPIDVQVAEAELATAQAVLSEAERELERVLDGPQAGELALLEAQIEKGQRDFETFSAGPDPEDVALTEVRIANAEAQLAAAKAAIADRELLAPFEGVISAVHVNPGEWVAPGSPVLLIGGLDHLQVETTDLSEFDVAKIMVGDPAIITFDSLPDLEIQGAVTRIAPKSSGGSGVNFPVIIELGEVPAALRWGMTAFVDIEFKK